MNNTKQVAIRIFQHDEIAVRAVAPRIPAGPCGDEPFDFRQLVGCVEIEMQSTALPRAPFGHPIQGDVRPFALRVTKDHPAVLWGLTGDIVKRCRPER